MAKISVSIPDELLTRARVASGDEEIKMSQLVQRGLEALLGPPRPAYAALSDESEALLRVAREAQIGFARAEYQRGYDQALRRSVDMPLSFLDYLARNGHSVRVWAEGRRDGELDSEGREGVGEGLAYWEEDIAKDLGRYLDDMPMTDEGDFYPTAAYVGGYEAALRDLWTAISTTTSEASGRPTSRPGPTN